MNKTHTGAGTVMRQDGSTVEITATIYTGRAGNLNTWNGSGTVRLPDTLWDDKGSTVTLRLQTPGGYFVGDVVVGDGPGNSSGGFETYELRGTGPLAEMQPGA